MMLGGLTYLPFFKFSNNERFWNVYIVIFFVVISNLSVCSVLFCFSRMKCFLLFLVWTLTYMGLCMMAGFAFTR